ncbi:Protein of unknown function [Bacillus toyonensis]|nr:Protein of unknown function [Bacillus toyonensis]
MQPVIQVINLGVKCFHVVVVIYK